MTIFICQTDQFGQILNFKMQLSEFSLAPSFNMSPYMPVNGLVSSWSYFGHSMVIRTNRGCHSYMAWPGRERPPEARSRVMWHRCGWSVVEHSQYTPRLKVLPNYNNLIADTGQSILNMYTLCTYHRVHVAFMICSSHIIMDVLGVLRLYPFPRATELRKVALPEC